MGVSVWTVGHGAHTTPILCGLLEAAQIGVVIDVRSVPYSRLHPQHRQRPLMDALRRTGIDYAFLGRELGGRPDDPAVYDLDGRVRYDLVRELPTFAAGLARLRAMAEERRAAIMCAEEDPTGCHRRLLVGRVLAEQGVEVLHLRGDGTVLPETALPTQLALFDDWRSPGAVRRGLG